ncbi:diguanylate cyclase [Loktanella sp. S4079]|uniref:diguanylate cyclase n=1 Tax=Loktanella sp. S4079 TaxID=579483 RepID=UPI0005FA2F1C|nr:diguanylate cyclase [Loktanella sp. S4079]KJZ19683.1 diguanylate cyclase [Loktanella sp. S4079]
MPGRILIVDTVATNRIVMKVKMLAAQFRVDVCATRAEAEKCIQNNPPDLILVSLGEPVSELHEFCQSLRTSPHTQNIAIIAMGVAEAPQARFAALDAGADDVMPRPTNDALLLARIRSLLRVHSTHQELQLRDGTRSALGFEETAATFETPAHVSLLSAAGCPDSNLLATLTQGLGQIVRSLDPDTALRGGRLRPTPDLLVVDASDPDQIPSRFFGLVSDLRARPETRQATQLVIVPEQADEMAAMFLDLGADDVVSNDASPAEIALRAQALIRRKRLHDRLRDTVRDGLQAAVTDPLTGLFNRRYVDPHLSRMTKQAVASGDAMAVMMLDIDHFKSINDTYGHAAGDCVLKQLSKRLKNNLRAIDLVARVGGEEFLIALPGTTAAEAQVTADRLLKVVNGQPFDIGDLHQPLIVTISVGVAMSPNKPSQICEPNAICEQADAALYAAKSAGRDQVAMAASIA